MKQLLEATSPSLPPNLSQATAYVLMYELLLGQGLRDHGPAEKVVVGMQQALESQLSSMMKKAGAKVRSHPVDDALAQQRMHYWF